jgi:hypothetical protein
MADERPETASTQGSFNAMGVLTIGIGLVLATTVYLLVDQSIIFPNLSSTITRSGSAKGVLNVVMATLILLTLMVTMFSMRTVIPNIMRDPEKKESIAKTLREMVIPISATIFFILFFYQFIMSGREVSDSRDFQDKIGILLILVILGGIAQGVRVVMSGGSVVWVGLMGVVGSGLILLALRLLKGFFGM